MTEGLNIIQSYKIKMKFTKDDIEDLGIILDEYLHIFKNKKAHKKAHKKDPCSICESGKEILKKIKKELKE